MNIFNVNKHFIMMMVSVLLFTVFIPNFIVIYGKSKMEADDYVMISEKILSLEDENLLQVVKSNQRVDYLANNLNISQEFKGGRDVINDQLSNIKNLSAIEVLAINENNIDKTYNLDQKQKSVAKQIQKLITNFIQKSFGVNYSVYNLTLDQKEQLEQFILTDNKIKMLNKTSNRKTTMSNSGIIAQAARWENCEWETDFPDWVGYEYKTYYGVKANWVGRVANTEDERSGVMPCDFSFYLNNYRANKVDGWSIATECAVKWSNGVSAKRYGYSNQKMIIGHGRLTACGVWSFNTEMLRDQIRFYT